MKILLIIFITLILISLVSPIMIIEQEDPGYIIKIGPGKVLVSFNDSRDLYAKDIILANPEIDYISYTEENKTIGYVNIFHGVGKNFLIEENKVYEIFVKEEINLTIK
jgi:hypothetical protein